VSTDTLNPADLRKFPSGTGNDREETSMRIQHSRCRAGFSLIELSVATAIYSMGLGSLSLMMMVAVQGTTEAGYEGVAALEAASLAEQILMNSGAVGHYIIDPGGDPPDCGGGFACTAEEMAAWTLQAWRNDLALALPAGSGLVCADSTPGDGEPADAACDGAGGPVVKVFWEIPEVEGEPDSGTGRQVARLPVP
jgi:type IV pilus assembly protein PilV